MNDTDNKALNDSLKVTIIGSVINVILVVVKIVLGIMGNSRALFADGIHSLTDLVTDLIVIGGLIIGSKPQDDSHHYGHGKVETLAEMGLGVILIFAGLAIVFNSVKTMLMGTTGPPLPIVVPAAIASIVLKEYLYQATIRVARRNNRPSLVANAWHHRSDALTSVGVLLGVGLAIIFPALVIVDSIVGLVVASVVVKVGWGIAWEAAMKIVDTAPSHDHMARIKEMMLSVPGTRSVRDLKMRYVGSLIAVEVHLGLDPNMSVRQGHDVATAVKKYVLEKDNRVFDVLVHVEPEDSEIRDQRSGIRDRGVSSVSRD
ncbi:cation transporter [bacterium]|nr:MAG: cation transporter [bacterium]